MITFVYVPIILHQRKLLDRSVLCINMHLLSFEIQAIFLSETRVSLPRREKFFLKKLFSIGRRSPITRKRKRERECRKRKRRYREEMMMMMKQMPRTLSHVIGVHHRVRRKLNIARRHINIYTPLSTLC